MTSVVVCYWVPSRRHRRAQHINETVRGLLQNSRAQDNIRYYRESIDESISSASHVCARQLIATCTTRLDTNYDCRE